MSYSEEKLRALLLAVREDLEAERARQRRERWITLIPGLVVAICFLALVFLHAWRSP